MTNGAAGTAAAAVRASDGGREREREGLNAHQSWLLGGAFSVIEDEEGER